MKTFKGEEIFSSGLCFEVWWTKEWDPENPDDVILGTDRVMFLFNKIKQLEGGITAWIFKSRRKRYTLYRQYEKTSDPVEIKRIYKTLFTPHVLLIKTSPSVIYEMLDGCYTLWKSGVLDYDTKRIVFNLHGREEIILPDSVEFGIDGVLARIGGDGDTVSIIKAQGNEMC